MAKPHCLHKEGLRGRVGPIVAGVVFVLLVAITGINFFYYSKRYSKNLIARDLKSLQELFLKIDERCRILSFDYQKNPINFLNVRSFEGSEVGPMNLAYPNEWEGPYLDKNPIMQGIEYQVVRTKRGHFIVPGDYVMLPNGKTVGKDIILDQDADIEAMLQEGGLLNFRGIALAAPLPLKTGVWRTLIRELVSDRVGVAQTVSREREKNS